MREEKYDISFLAEEKINSILAEAKEKSIIFYIFLSILLN